MGRRLVVVSMDGLSVREWAELGSQPNFAALMARGAVSTSLKSVYPSSTYVAHATMMTGRHPDAHGITQNQLIVPGLSEEARPWHWYAREVAVPTLFDLARAAGMSTAAVLWPLVSGARITWNLPEISALPGENQVFKAMRAGSPAFLLDLQLRFGKYRRGTKQPWLDDFISRSASYTIVRRRPGLLMCHLIGLDAAKHVFGSEAPETKAALAQLDTALGRIAGAIEEAGLAGETMIAVFGDHGHVDTQRRVRPNKLLEEAGLCGFAGGSFRWRAWLGSAGGSAFLYARPGDAGAGDAALGILRKALGEEMLGIERLLSSDELRALHADPGALCALEGKPGTQFLEDLDGPLVEDCTSPGAFGADHGYHPDSADYRSLFLAAGPGIRAGARLGELEMADLAPTLAAWLGLHFEKTDGLIRASLFDA